MIDFFLDKNFFDNTYIGIIVLDEKNIIKKANNATMRMTGYKRGELYGQNLSLLGLKRFNKETYKDFKRQIAKKNHWEGDVWIRKKNGELTLVKRTVLKVKGNVKSENKYILLSVDFSDKLNDELINDLLYKDVITGLPTKHVYNEILNSVLSKYKHNNHRLPIIFLSPARFKKINNSFGFLAGDKLLKEIVDRLKNIIGDEIPISRIGGDLFSFFLPSHNTYTKTAQMLDKILEDFNQKPFKVKDQDVYLSLNMGISFYPTDGNNIKDLFRHSNYALSKAKEQGQNTYNFYTNDVNVHTFEKFVMETNLKKAIKNNEFILYYQPQVDVNTNEVTSFEALIRWNHPELGIITPSKFIPIAEEAGLISQIGEWVLNEACKQNKEWQDNGFKPVSVAVNLSPKQFHRQDIVDMIENALEKTDLDANYLEVEVTETTIMKDMNKTIDTLDKLKKLGVKVAIDDFGKGYSSLYNLTRFPLNSLKIDRSFILNLDKNKHNRIITSMIIAMGNELGLDVIAEGVEQPEHVQFLKEEKCHKYQGFYFSPPIPPKSVEKFLKKED